MKLAKKTILLTSFLMCQNAQAESPYLISFGDDLWSSELLTETCPLKLERAIDEVRDRLSNPNRELVALLPEQLEYQYFVVEFKKLEGSLIKDLKKPLFYQFQYWTRYDEHNRCLKVEPYRPLSISKTSK